MRLGAEGLLALAALCVGLGGCATNELTELVVVVDTDYAVPEELDRIAVEITGPSGQTQTQSAELRGEQAPELPLVLFLEHGGGQSGPVAVVASGHSGEQKLVQQTVRTAFVRGDSRVVRINLLKRCEGVGCKDAQGSTCGARGCRAARVPREELRPWTGQDGEPTCNPEQETCNGRDDDCNGKVDEGWDFASDPTNCGFCGRTCEGGAHQTERCMDGACVFECAAGWADCNDDPSDGCEANLGLPEHCGSCSNRCGEEEPLCNTTGDEPRCATECSGPGMEICGNSCVDTSSSPNHCGDCNSPCTTSLRNAIGVCEGGSCTIECDSGWGDCNDDLDSGSSDGCETPLTTTRNCGECGNHCDPQHASSQCSNQQCAIGICEGSWRDCDGSVSNGCEERGTTYYADHDGDGYGSPDSTSEPRCEPAANQVANMEDCDDTESSINPDATESCNGVDDDCDDTRDEGYNCVQGATMSCQTSCGSQGTRLCGSDCTWEDTCMPPADDDTCDDVDDDCDGMLNEDATDCGVDCSHAITVTGSASFSGDLCNAANTVECDYYDDPDHVYRVELGDAANVEVSLFLPEGGEAVISYAGSNCPPTIEPECADSSDEETTFKFLDAGTHYFTVQDSFGCAPYNVSFQIN
jgi:hypothetical protein